VKELEGELMEILLGDITLILKNEEDMDKLNAVMESAEIISKPTMVFREGLRKAAELRFKLQSESEATERLHASLKGAAGGAGGLQGLEETVRTLRRIEKEYSHLSPSAKNALKMGSKRLTELKTEDTLIFNLESAIVARILTDIDSAVTAALKIRFAPSTRLDSAIQRAIAVQEEIAADRRAVYSLRIANASGDATIINDVLKTVKELPFTFSDNLEKTIREAEDTYFESIANSQLSSAIYSKDVDELQGSIKFVRTSSSRDEDHLAASTKALLRQAVDLRDGIIRRNDWRRAVDKAEMERNLKGLRACVADATEARLSTGDLPQLEKAQSILDELEDELAKNVLQQLEAAVAAVAAVAENYGDQLERLNAAAFAAQDTRLQADSCDILASAINLRDSLQREQDAVTGLTLAVQGRDLLAVTHAVDIASSLGSNVTKMPVYSSAKRLQVHLKLEERATEMLQGAIREKKYPALKKAINLATSETVGFTVEASELLREAITLQDEIYFKIKVSAQLTAFFTIFIASFYHLTKLHIYL
jgi:hypothetical protein